MATHTQMSFPFSSSFLIFLCPCFSPSLPSAFWTAEEATPGEEQKLGAGFADSTEVLKGEKTLLEGKEVDCQAGRRYIRTFAARRELEQAKKDEVEEREWPFVAWSREVPGAKLG